MTTRAADLATLGGKAANLARLADGGLPVPRFVVVTTDAYDAFVDAAGLRPLIEAALAEEARAASDAITAAFAASPLPDDLRARLTDDLTPLLGSSGELAAPVAVRSSATTEDLPGFSFAGQQDTFLGVATLDEALTRIRDCWASLWTERAIAYRTHHDIGHAVSLAVVVQQMVDADAAGVLFTANPRTGRRDETVVDATAGLGEALVSGQVTPDTFTVETATGEIRERLPAGAEASITDEHLRGLVALGRRIVELYDEPMDVEWAREGDDLYVLQARPITSLFPLPLRSEPDAVWGSFGAFQGMLEPITPVGRDVLAMIIAGAPRIVGHRVDWRANGSFAPAGERLWLRLDGILRLRPTRALLGELLPMAEPSVAAILEALADEPGLRPERTRPPLWLLAGLSTLGPRMAARARTTVAHPVQARRTLDRAAERLVADTAAAVARASGQATPQARLDGVVDAMEALGRTGLPTLMPLFGPMLVPAMTMLRRLRAAAARTGLPDADALALSVMRALPGNVTTEMDLRLADAAAAIRGDANAWGWVAETPASDLARQFRAGRLPRVAQQAIGVFMDEYGMRGVAEIDLGAPRWRDDPTPVMHTVKAYLGQCGDASPRARHKAGQHEAGRAIRRLMDASPRPQAEKISHWARTIRSLAGARETPKFTLIRCLGHLRDGLDAAGAELVAQGRLERAEDVVFLHLDELRRAFTADWRALVAERRAVRDAEARRTQVPRVLLGDGRAFYEGLGASGDLGGLGVSPGVAEGPVRVVRDPREAQLPAGEILVCRGTDPAWTPLFLTAGGLVTEVGGLMTHGSVVARECGIPAVVGVHEATTRLRDGQRVRIDGMSGAIEVL